MHEGEADAIASCPETRMGNDKKHTERLGSDLKKTDGTGEPPKVFNKVEIDGGDSSLSVAFTQKKNSQDREEKRTVEIEATSREMRQSEVKHAKQNDQRRSVAPN